MTDAEPVPAPTPAPTPTPVPPKPGYKTTEFWLHMVLPSVIAMLMQSGLFGPSSWQMTILGFIAAQLGASVYGIGRSMVKSKAGTATLLSALVFLAAASQLAACACTDPSSTACIVQHAVVDCTEGTVVSQAPGFIPFLAQLVNIVVGSGGTFDWANLEKALAGFGLKDVGCIKAELEAALLSAPLAMSPERAAATQAYHAAWASWVTQHFPAGTRFKLHSGASL